MHNRIKMVRESLQLSQREFGEKLGVSRDVISNIESVSYTHLTLPTILLV